MHRTHTTNQITPEKDGDKAALLGWVETKRDLGKIKFIVLRDYKGKIQITLPPSTDKSIVEVFNKLNREDVISVEGKIKNMPKAPNGAEVIPTSILIINKAVTPLPLETTGKVDADLDTRLDNRILDLRRPKTNAIFKIRNQVINAVREFFIQEDFTEINTPKIIASATEGGTELFPVAYFEKEAFLAQSPQLYKEQLTSVFEKVYEIGHVFRAEESSTRRHLAELMMIDFEVAFYDYTKVMDTAEALLNHVFTKVHDNCSKEFEILGREFKVPETPYPRYTYTEIIELLSKNGMEIPWGEDLHTEAIRKLGELIPGPYFITDWPTAEKPFYVLPKKDNPKVCEAFDLMYGWLELASGSTRIHDKQLLEQKIKEKDMSAESFSFHLKTFDWGMPPHAGCGLGLARLVMVITGAENIRETVLFPRDKNRLTP